MKFAKFFEKQLFWRTSAKDYFHIFIINLIIIITIIAFTTIVKCTFIVRILLTIPLIVISSFVCFNLTLTSFFWNIFFSSLISSFSGFCAQLTDSEFVYDHQRNFKCSFYTFIYIYSYLHFLIYTYLLILIYT